MWKSLKFTSAIKLAIIIKATNTANAMMGQYLRIARVCADRARRQTAVMAGLLLSFVGGHAIWFIGRELKSQGHVTLTLHHKSTSQNRTTMVTPAKSS